MAEASSSKTIVKAPVRSPRKRLGYALFQGAKAVVFSFLRTFYVLWLEVTGFVFAGLTVMGVSAFVRLYRHQAWVSDGKRFWVTVGFTIFCLWLTVISFVRARRKPK